MGFSRRLAHQMLLLGGLALDDDAQIVAGVQYALIGKPNLQAGCACFPTELDGVAVGLAGVFGDSPLWNTFLPEYHAADFAG